MILRTGIFQLIQMASGYVTLLIIINTLSAPQYLAYGLYFSIISLGVGYDFGLTHRINSALSARKIKEIGHAIKYWIAISCATIVAIILAVDDLTLTLIIVLLLFALILPIGKAIDHALTQEKLFGLRAALVSIIFLLLVIIESNMLEASEGLQIVYLQSYMISAVAGTCLALIIGRLRVILFLFTRSWMRLHEQSVGSIAYLAMNRWHAINSLVGYLMPAIIIYIFSKGDNQELFGHILIAFNLIDRVFRLAWAIIDASSIHIKPNISFQSQRKYNISLITIPAIGIAIASGIFLVTNRALDAEIWQSNILQNVIQHESFYWQALLASILYAISHHLGVYLIFKFDDQLVGRLTLLELITTVILAASIQINLINITYWPLIIIINVLLIHLLPLSLRLKTNECK